MQRRQFLKFTSAFSVGVLLSRISHAQPNGRMVLNAPDKVFMQTGDTWFQMQPAGGDSYTYEDCTVTIQTANDVQTISVTCPGKSLQAIRIQWQHEVAAETMCLGDHWERSYGDLQWRPYPADVECPWYMLVHDGTQTACFGVQTGANSLCSWKLGKDMLQLTLNTRSGGNGVQLGGRTLQAANIVTMQSKDGENPFYTDHRFCGMMCPNPRLPKQPVYGLNDWNFAYGKNSFELIKTTTAAMAHLVSHTDNKPYSVIDAGWAEYSPLLPGDGGWNEDFSKPNDKFKDMHKMADTIKQLGMRPGLWMRPLCGRHDEKQSLLSPSIPGRDNPKNPTLDPTITENLARIQNYFEVYNQWGYEMVKHDFTTYDITGRWGFQMTDGFTTPGWYFHDTTKTNAEIILQLYRTIRQSAGDKIAIIGCNTVSHLTAGLFEVYRSGDDTSGREWERTVKMGVNTLAFRLPQHNKMYCVDGDCVGITTVIPWQRNKQWLQLSSESSSALFISAEPAAMGAIQKAAVKEAFAKVAKPQPLAEPIDWMTNLQPKQWKLNGREVMFDWS